MCGLTPLANAGLDSAEVAVETLVVDGEEASWVAPLGSQSRKSNVRCGDATLLRFASPLPHENHLSVRSERELMNGCGSYLRI